MVISYKSRIQERRHFGTSISEYIICVIAWVNKTNVMTLVFILVFVRGMLSLNVVNTVVRKDLSGHFRFILLVPESALSNHYRPSNKVWTSG